MKHQFKFNPLATAILTLLCGSSMASYADPIDAVTTTGEIPVAPQNNVNNQKLQQALKESFPGQNFFEQYYVDKNSAEAQIRDDVNTATNRYCDGVWVTPFDQQSKSTSPQDGSSVITADHGYYNPNGDSVLSGDVVIDQQGRMIRADEVILDQSQTIAKAKGNVQMAQGGLIAQSDQIDYNLKEAFEKLNSHQPVSCPF